MITVFQLWAKLPVKSDLFTISVMTHRVIGRIRFNTCVGMWSSSQVWLFMPITSFWTSLQVSGENSQVVMPAH